MSAFIKLNKQDAYVVPYTAHKSYSYSTPAERVAAGVHFALGENDATLFSSASDNTSGGQYNKLTYRSIKQLYYSNSTSSIDTSGSFYDYPQTTLYSTRSLGDTAALVLIPKSVYGQNIKPGTFKFISGSSFKVEDDGEGNLIASGSVTYTAVTTASIEEFITETTGSEDIGYLNIPINTQMDLNGSTVKGVDEEWTLVQVRWLGSDVTSPYYLASGTLQSSNITDSSILSHLSFSDPNTLISDDENAISFVDTASSDKTTFTFVSASVSQSITYSEVYPSASIADGEHLGNIFYAHGNAVITKEDIAARFYGQVLRSGSLEWQGTHTIYQHEYRCKVNESSLNYSQNPSTVQSGSDGTVYDFVTGSYFQPYVTTVGLYNDSNELIAVGKLAQPVPKSRYTDMNFVVKFDV